MVATTLYKETKQVSKTQFRAEIVFGRPSVECEDIGICRASLITKNKPFSTCKKCKENKTVGLITILAPNHIEFTFFKNLLNTTLYHQHLATNFFTIKEAFYFEEGAYHFSLPIGRYPIYETEHFVKIVFNY